MPIFSIVFKCFFSQHASPKFRPSDPMKLGLLLTQVIHLIGGKSTRLKYGALNFSEQDMQVAKKMPKTLKSRLWPKKSLVVCIGVMIYFVL